MAQEAFEELKRINQSKDYLVQSVDVIKKIAKEMVKEFPDANIYAGRIDKEVDKQREEALKMIQTQCKILILKALHAVSEYQVRSKKKSFSKFKRPSKKKQTS